MSTAQKLSLLLFSLLYFIEGRYALDNSGSHGGDSQTYDYIIVGAGILFSHSFNDTLILSLEGTAGATLAYYLTTETCIFLLFYI